MSYALLCQDNHVARDSGGRMPLDLHTSSCEFLNDQLLLSLLLLQQLFVAALLTFSSIATQAACGMFSSMSLKLLTTLLFGVTMVITLSASVSADDRHTRSQGSRRLQQAALAINPSDPVSATTADLVNDPTGRGHLLVCTGARIASSLGFVRTHVMILFVELVASSLSAY